VTLVARGGQHDRPRHLSPSEGDDMFHPDTQAARQLAQERQAQLKQDWQPAEPARSEVLETRHVRQHRLRRLWVRLRLAGNPS
jgi:hypothetical protein